jgi:hypothetical protein
MHNSTQELLHNKMNLSTTDCELKETWDTHWTHVDWDLYIKICKQRKPINIRQTIRQGGDIQNAVRQNIKLHTKNRTPNLPNYDS